MQIINSHNFKPQKYRECQCAIDKAYSDGSVVIHSQSTGEKTTLRTAKNLRVELENSSKFFKDFSPLVPDPMNNDFLWITHYDYMGSPEIHIVASSTDLQRIMSWFIE